MKSNFLPVIASVIFLAGCSASSSTAKNEKKEAQFEQTTALIDGGTYEFTAKSANPTGGRTVQITSTYTLEVKDGIYKAYLPYYGRAYNASYGGNGGVEFEGEPSDLSIVKDPKKLNFTVKFNIKNKDERYDCILFVGYGGSGTLTVNSSNRQSISYSGAVASPSE